MHHQTTRPRSPAGSLHRFALGAAGGLFVLVLGCQETPPSNTAATAPTTSPLPSLTQGELDQRLVDYLWTSDADVAGVRALLDLGADPDAADPRNARNPVIALAAMNVGAAGQIAPVIDLLVEAGANIDAQNANGMTAAMGSTSNDHPVVAMEAVLSHGANPDLTTSKGLNLLMWAVIANPCTALVPLVLDTEVDVNAVAADGRTALGMSIGLCTPQCDAILERGGTADPALVLDDGRTLLSLAELVASESSEFNQSRTFAYLRARAANQRDSS